ncbi:MAG: hypothetical protein QW343_01045 [Candidatus Norongarragalinales archaeon]
MAIRREFRDCIQEFQDPFGEKEFASIADVKKPHLAREQFVRRFASFAYQYSVQGFWNLPKKRLRAAKYVDFTRVLRPYASLSDAISLSEDSLLYGLNAVARLKIGAVAIENKILSALWLARLYESLVFVHGRRNLLKTVERELMNAKNHVDVGRVVSGYRSELMHEHVYCNLQAASDILNNALRDQARVKALSAAYAKKVGKAEAEVTTTEIGNAFYASMRVQSLYPQYPNLIGLMEWLKRRNQLHRLFDGLLTPVTKK